MKSLAIRLKRHNVLVTSDLVGEADLRRLAKFSNVYSSSTLDQKALDELLPQVDALVIFSWPGFLTKETLTRMNRLRFIQSILVGVNQVPFRDLSEKVVICSNAGAYSLEVGEHAFGLLLSAAKKIVETHDAIRRGRLDFEEFRGVANDILVLRGRTLGVVGYGGIGAVTGRLGKAFGMKVLAFSRRRRTARGVQFRRGRKGMETLLRHSDAVVLAVPLTRTTTGMIGDQELSMMKRDAVLVNISRGDIVDQRALYEHMKRNPGFRYATDVWWFRDGKETLTTDYPFASLPNFVGTPHISGPTGIATGRPAGMAVDNTIRYLKGLRPRNVVERSEYALNSKGAAR